MRFLIFFLAILTAHPVWAGLPVPVIQALRDADIPPASVALYVRQVDRPQPLIAHQADRAMNPASVMKLVTTYAGLEILGPAYSWKTEIHAAGPIKDGVLDGDLILKGYGDPALTLAGFWELLRSLRNTGLREIKGNLVLDRGYFEPSAADPGAFDGEPWRAYNATPDALLVNFKATQFGFRVEQDHVVVVADPDLPQLKAVNRLELRQAPCVDWKDRLDYQVTREPTRYETEQVVIAFNGSYAAACGEQTLNLALLDDSGYVFQLFRQLWHEQGGTLAGTLKQGDVPANARLVLQGNSPPLAEAVRMINKNSNNVMARQMLLTIGAEKAGVPGSVEKGAAVVRQWLGNKGLDFSELVIENGAGLSRVERIGARHLGELLVAAWHSPVMPELMSSLPIAAVDGTLEKRLKNTPVAGSAHIKTGSLDGVRAMAGYLLDRRGRRWVVVFVVNHAHAAASHAAQDALLQWLYDRN
ncbi:MAG TPA: D-alanyl-D-alanine carboxypeptidase/D-alanyl-D-alanine-endopeptidase [Novimethylophilus sp.]|jgi:D-alanyl-D-alanine carboxypeptidase/D-alanyl-D-alanine-endopeptidase (penicillin-binding protein 4)|uniref:D-alanyl-D-alanine carboxypeptidase/D-alanyl-D-alanine endopeptidase n=1 Tax=Novimethylophilus sp. TaxID=2137426 RepID=UPI002F42AAFF